MDPDGGAETQKAVSLQWKSYKLVQDPTIRRVSQKIYRYDGVHFSVPDSGFPPVGELRDPRPRRLWSRYTELSLPVPKFKLDEFYVGPIPLKEVTFARLNDNIKEPFLAEMCAKFGEVEEMEILFHPKTRKHLGLARVLFTSTRGAKDTVKHLHNTSVMGNIIHAQLDIKGQQRQKYYDLIVNGSYTPQTVPLGGKALTDRVQPPTPTQPQPDTSSEIRRRLSSELAVLAAGVQALTSGSITPCSADTGYSESRLDTPPSSGPFTPGSSASSQGGTPHSSRSGTPFSQDLSFSGGRHTGFNTGTLSSGYPPQDMLPSSSSSSAVSSTVGGFKVSRYSEDAQEPAVHHRGRPIYPPTPSYRSNEPPCYPSYPGVGGPGPHMGHHSSMPPPPFATQYDQPLMSDRERDRDSGGRYGAGSVGSRRSSYHHQQDTNSSSKYHSHHSHHHSDRRDERGYRRDSLGSRSGDHSHQRHRNHHHSHNHHSSSRRRSSHDRDRDRDRDRERDRDSDYSNSSDPRYNSNSYRSSSNSMSPPPSSYSSYSSSSKEPTPAPPQGLDVSSRLAERTSQSSVGADKDFHTGHHSALPPPPPPPPPLPPASVIAAAVAETLGTLDFNQDSPAHEEQWTKPKRRPSTPPAPPKTPPPPPSSPPLPSVPSSSTSPSSTCLPQQLPSSSSSPPPPQRDSSSPEPDSTNESLPFAYHSSSLDSRIEMLLKEQKAKFSFLASDEEEEEDRKEEKQRGVGGVRGERKDGVGDALVERPGDNEVGDNGGRDHRRKGERDSHRGRKHGKGGEGRRSPAVLTSATPSSTFSAHILPPVEPLSQVGLTGTGALQEESSQSGPADTLSRTGAHTPPYNGQSQSSPNSSGEDMEISDEEEVETTITTVDTHQPSVTSGSSPSSSQAVMPSQKTDPSSSPQPISDSTQHFGTSMHPPIPSYPPHLPPPPPPGYSLQPPPPPGIPPLSHMELHPEYPPPIPHHMYDYATSMELMNQYSGGAPMSFQMQTHMLSRLHQLRMASANGTPGPGEAATADYSSYHLHSMPPPHTHHPYMDQEGRGAASHYDQDHRYMPPHMPYPYADPHSTQIPPPPHHGMPPPHTGWPPHVLPPHFPSYPPPGYGTMLPRDGGEYRAPGEEMPIPVENPHEATVQSVLANLIQEMKNIMQRDLNRKMVENVAFATFDEWWDRKETKAKPFQTMVRGVSALRDDEKKEEKVNRPREPLTSLVDWAKSGGMEGFSLRGALRLPSFKVKRKEPQELQEGDMKRPRPSTPPDEDDEATEGRIPEADRRAAERDNKRRKKKPRSRKPWELGSEGEETSDGSSSEKEDEEEESEKESDDDALSADSDDESLSSSSEGSSSSASSSSSSSEDEGDEGERVESDGPDTMDDSTMDSATEKEEDRETIPAAVPKTEVKPGEVKDSKADTTAPTKRPPSPPLPRPSSPVVLVPPLKKRRKTVSFSTGDNESKPSLLTAPLSPSPSPSQAAGESPLVSPSKPPDSPITAPTTPPSRATQGIQLLPFASKPGEGNALIVPSPGRVQDPDEYKKGPPVSPQTTPVKSPGKRGASKESPKSPAPSPVMVCRTVQNLPLDHASMCRMAFEEAPPPPPVNKRSRGRPRTTSIREDEEDETEQRLRLREQLGASSLLQLASADLSVLADVALKMDPEGGDSEETETSDEAEEQKMEDSSVSSGSMSLLITPEGLIVLMEHNYCRPPPLTAPAGTKRTSSKTDSILLSTDLNAMSGVLEAPEEVIGDALPPRGDTGEYLPSTGVLSESEDAGQAAILSPSKKIRAGKGFELENDKSKVKRRKDKENLEVDHAKKQKELPGKKQRKRKLEDSEEDVDVEELESGELSSSDTEDEVVEEVRKSERLFLQEAGVTSSQRWPKPLPAPEPLLKMFDNRSEFEQMTILYDIWNSGLDGEDLTLLKKTYEKLLQEDHGSDWLNDTHWVSHTITNLPNPRRKKKNADGQLREHVTGCARSEGYYAISRKEKDVYLDLDLPEQVIREVENVDTSGANRLLSERRSEQRRLLTVIGATAVMDSDLLKLNQLKFRKKKLRFGRSRIHEWGLFAMEAIAADEMVIEYVGQNIRQMVADNREKRYAQQGIGSSYLFRVDHDTIIDATKCGNLARFINHCCTPNCYAKVITIESQKKIVIYSKQPIAVNEEITYDYKFPLEENKIPCLCGTENCRGTLN